MSMFSQKRFVLCDLCFSLHDNFFYVPENSSLRREDETLANHHCVNRGFFL